MQRWINAANCSRRHYETRGQEHISQMLLINKGQVYDRRDITSTFREYYHTLYNISVDDPPSVETIAAYIHDTHLHRIQEHEQSILEAPITVQEFQQALTQSYDRKGPDGFTQCYYKTF